MQNVDAYRNTHTIWIILATTEDVIVSLSLIHTGDYYLLSPRTAITVASVDEALGFGRIVTFYLTAPCINAYYRPTCIGYRPIGSYLLPTTYRIF